jgi:hypothetical protein
MPHRWFPYNAWLLPVETSAEEGLCKEETLGWKKKIKIY